MPETFYIKSNDKALLKAIDKISDKVKAPSKLMRKIAQIMIEHTDENFETEGENAHENWEDWSEPYALWRTKQGNATGKKLQLEGEMKEGISRETTNNTAMIYSDKEYAALHNFGGDIRRGGKKTGEMPRRTFMKWTDELTREILDEAETEIFLNENYNESFLT